MNELSELRSEIVNRGLMQGIDVSKSVNAIDSVYILRFIVLNNVDIGEVTSSDDWLEKEFDTKSKVDKEYILNAIKSGATLEDLKSTPGKEHYNMHKKKNYTDTPEELSYSIHGNSFTIGIWVGFIILLFIVVIIMLQLWS